MIDELPQIWDYFADIVRDYWVLVTGCGILAGFFVLAVIDKIFRIFDIIKR